MNRHFFSILCLIILGSCSAWKDPSKYRLSNGKYRLQEGQAIRSVYVKVNDGDVEVHNASTDTSKTSDIKIWKVETSTSSLPNSKAIFSKKTFDLDFLTVPIKLRPGLDGFPAQMNTNINGSFFVGFRYDQYKIKYRSTYNNMYEREINHFGYSIGLFNGLGATALNPWVTANKINIEYDGVVYLKGIALLLGIDNLNFGLALGVDHLLDANRNNWIYQGRPWLGLTLGLNLN